MDRRQLLIALNLIPGLGPVTIGRLMAAFESPEELFRAAPRTLKELLGRYGKDTTVAEIVKAADGRGLCGELKTVQEAGIQIVTSLDGGYPELLKEIPDPPPVLYVKGALLKEDAASVALVGTRAASPYGLATARRLGYELARAGITVVSGLAEGVDGAGHQGALEAKGRTIAVLGHGLRSVYPSCHKRLAERIVDSGALVSEFPFHFSPTPENFPRRNRVIAGLSLGVIVVEAPEKSGALITAREALDQGREVFAVPGPVSSPKSRGTHQLLKEGAKLVEGIQDIVEELAPHLRGQLGPLRQEDQISEGRTSGMGLTEEESVVYEAIPVAEGAMVQSLVQATDLAPSRLLTLLTSLELKGLVRHLPGQGYSRER